MNDVTIEDWLGGNWMESVIEMYVGGVVGYPLLGAMLTGGVIISMYIYSDDMALPTIVLILLSSFAFASLPGDLQQTAMGVMVVGIAAAIFEILRRYFI